MVVFCLGCANIDGHVELNCFIGIIPFEGNMLMPM